MFLLKPSGLFGYSKLRVWNGWELGKEVDINQEPDKKPAKSQDKFKGHWPDDYYDAE